MLDDSNIVCSLLTHSEHNSFVSEGRHYFYKMRNIICTNTKYFQRFPIYTQRTMEIYMGKRRNEVPPHIFAIAEGAFQGMMNGGKNQSILIT